MTDSATVPPAPRRRRLILVLAVLVLAALGTRLWLGHRQAQQALAAEQALNQKLTRQLAAVQASLDQFSAKQAQLASAEARDAGDLAALGQRLDQSQQAMSQITETVRGGRRRFQLMSAEQLLLAANDRLQLWRDVGGAVKALELAEARLAGFPEPRLLAVRREIASEHAALAALPQADAAGASLALSALIAQAPQFALIAQAPTPPPSRETPVAPAAAAAEGSPLQRAWRALRTALGAVFSLRREDAALAQLLAPQDEALVRQLLLMQLESARFAVLRGDGASFREATGGADAWLARYYRVGDSGVKAARLELQRLHALDFGSRPPDLSRSLTLLRAELDAR